MGFNPYKADKDKRAAEQAARKKEFRHGYGRNFTPEEKKAIQRKRALTIRAKHVKVSLADI
jgi:hypothetical protein